MRRSAFLCLLACAMAVSARAQSHPDFSGTWKLHSERAGAKGGRDVTLAIVHHDPLLLVETTIVLDSPGSGGPRHAVQHYTTDGTSSVSTGADGDEFHTSIAWQGLSLDFTITEHEDNRILHEKETWTLVDNGAGLERVRERQDGTRQTLLYHRQPQHSMGVQRPK